ncbi:MAG: PEGA domain-containing protein [Terracidiphilus sp.]|nr:PEGA domain-containing protein [Terracidiphilus sp.]
MKRFLLLILLLSLSASSFASTHKIPYNVPCNELWRALKDTLRNSGKYGIIAIDNAEMTASYNIGGNLTGKRVNSAVLNKTGNENTCELQIQTAFSGLANNDAGDMKKRIDDSLTKLKSEPLPPPVAPPATLSDQSKAEVPAVQASLTIDSTPAGADIEVDGAFTGSTPSTLALAPGSHEITIKKKGFIPWSRKMNVTGGNFHLNAELEQAPKQ